MRRGELLSLRWTHVYLDECYLHLPDTKNGDSREVPLSTRACQVLRTLPRDASGCVFPISADSVKKAFERAVARAGIIDLHFHDLRHEATSRDRTLAHASKTWRKQLTAVSAKLKKRQLSDEQINSIIERQEEYATDRLGEAISSFRRAQESKRRDGSGRVADR